LLSACRWGTCKRRLCITCTQTGGCSVFKQAHTSIRQELQQLRTCARPMATIGSSTLPPARTVRAMLSVKRRSRVSLGPCSCVPYVLSTITACSKQQVLSNVLEIHCCKATRYISLTLAHEAQISCCLQNTQVLPTVVTTSRPKHHILPAWCTTNNTAATSNAQQACRN
jgi:hypothetical protein